MSDDVKPLRADRVRLPATMMALAKLKPEPGLWQTEAPSPRSAPTRC